jgi:hypothetical protein
MTISRAQMPRELYEQGSLSPQMEEMVQTIMKMTGVSREEAIRIIQTMENPQETMDDATMIQEGYGLEPRQQYGLGSIVKSISKGVKSVAKGVGDFAKSDLGKAALLAAGAYYAPAMFGGTVGFGPTSTYGSFARGLMNPKLIGPMTKAGSLGRTISSSLLGKKGVSAAIGGASLLAGIFGTEEQAQELYARDPAEFNARVKQYTKNLNREESEKVLKQIQADIAALGDVSQAEQIFKRNVAAEGGIMGIPTGEMRQNPEGVIERDYRDEGGFVPVGIKEKADDVPAMLSKNEFVMTADAVKGAGNGDIEKGAQIMYDNMKRLESRVV